MNKSNIRANISFSTKELAEQLRAQGHKVDMRQRTDGGYLITSIDGKKYSGAEGNKRARSMLGVELSEKRKAQTSHNVRKFIRGKKKERTLNDKFKRALRQAQKTWRKNKVKGELVAPNVKRHIREYGEEEALRYLERQTRYGQGYAYEKNVEYLAKYIEDIADGIMDAEVANQVRNCAAIIRAYTDQFKEAWISIIYALWYEVITSGGDETVAREAIRKTYEVMKG